MTRLLAWMLLMVFLGGCNTMEGLGKDVKKVGTAVEEKARR